MPLLRAQGSGHIINTLSTAGLKIVPGMAVYAGSKNAVRAIAEGLRQEAVDQLRVITISPGYVATDLPGSMTDAAARDQNIEAMRRIAIPPESIAAAIACAIAQPANVDVGKIVIRPTAQA